MRQVSKPGIDRRARGGRPSKTQHFLPIVASMLAKRPNASFGEVLERLRANGYSGGRTALYNLISAVRLVTAHHQEFGMAGQPTATITSTNEPAPVPNLES